MPESVMAVVTYGPPEVYLDNIRALLPGVTTVWVASEAEDTWYGHAVWPGHDVRVLGQPSEAAATRALNIQVERMLKESQP